MSYRINMYQADIGGCGYMRIELVAKYLNKILSEKVSVDTPMQFELSQLERHNPIIVSNAPNSSKIALRDLLVMQRVHTPDILALMQYIHQQLKTPIVYELDDTIHHLHSANPAYVYYFHPENKSQIFSILENCIRESDAMTVSTDYLKNVYSRFNKNIYVLPNCIDYDVFDEKNIRKHNHGDEIWIGWAGSTSHMPDLSDVVEPIKKILQEFPKTKLALGGFDGHYHTSNGKKRYLWDGIPYDRTVKIHWVNDMKNYPSLLSHFDIALAPLVDIVFNRCKSNLKFLEYSACGIPVIASAVEPYSQTIKDGETGLLIPLTTTSKKDSTSKLWYNAIKSLVINEQLRRTLADNAKLFVKQNYDMSVRVHDWFDVYKEVIERNKKDKVR